MTKTTDDHAIQVILTMADANQETYFKAKEQGNKSEMARSLFGVALLVTALELTEERRGKDELAEKLGLLSDALIALDSNNDYESVACVEVMMVVREMLSFSRVDEAA